MESSGKSYSDTFQKKRRTSADYRRAVDAYRKTSSKDKTFYMKLGEVLEIYDEVRNSLGNEPVASRPKDSAFCEHVEKMIRKQWKKTAATKKEVGGVVLEMSDGTFKERHVTGTEDSVTIGINVLFKKLPPGVKSIVLYHTHPPGHGVRPSTDDRRFMDREQLSIDTHYEKSLPVHNIICGKPEKKIVIDWYLSGLAKEQ